MTAVDPDDPALLDHVLVLAPYRRDADYLRRLLSEHGVAVDAVGDGAQLSDRLALSPGAVIATHEALTPEVQAAIGEHLEVQPDWSELPVVVLLDRSSPNARIRANLNRAWPRARLLFYQRPVTPVELISGVQSAMRARLRQRDVRDHIVREIELRRELNHRVKNILASVSSIFQMTLRGASSLEDFAEDFGGRLAALANVHSAVFHATDDAVPIGDIVDLTIEPYRHTGRERIVASGPEVVLKSNVATSLALCLHELATNAIKYGGLSVPQGRVSLRWDISDSDPQELSLAWVESGGPPVKEPAQSGYGMRYLKAALSSVFGETPAIRFDTAGLRCEVKGRLARLSCNP